MKQFLMEQLNYSKKVEIKELPAYFINGWYMSNKGWFEGFAIGYPTSNNALEATTTNDKIESLYIYFENACLLVNFYQSVIEFITGPKKNEKL